VGRRCRFVDIALQSNPISHHSAIVTRPFNHPVCILVIRPQQLVLTGDWQLFLEAEMAMTAQLLPDRARRFPITVPLQFRKTGMSHWLKGKTVNISRSGILFEADEMPAADSLIDIIVDFPTDSKLECHGLVVRTEGKSRIAVQIHHPNLYHQP